MFWISLSLFWYSFYLRHKHSTANVFHLHLSSTIESTDPSSQGGERCVIFESFFVFVMLSPVNVLKGAFHIPLFPLLSIIHRSLDDCVFLYPTRHLQWMVLRVCFYFSFFSQLLYFISSVFKTDLCKSTMKVWRQSDEIRW